MLVDVWLGKEPFKWKFPDLRNDITLLGLLEMIN